MEDLEHRITTCHPELQLKLVKTVWSAHVRTPEEDEVSEECVCKPPRACLCCNQRTQMVERDLLYAYQRLKDPTKNAEPVEDHLPASINLGASNLHSDKDLEDKIKPLEQRLQKVIRTSVEYKHGDYPQHCTPCFLVAKPGFTGR